MEITGSKEEDQEGQSTVSEWGEMALPGFRFHPTEEELVGYYLRRMVQGRRNSVELIASLDLYQYDPWQLPAMAFMGEKEWFFFCPRDKKYPNGARPNRVTASGYWKATGTDRPVRCSGDSRCIGLKKTLVFYTGRAPRGNKTEWIMNEYRMPKPAEQSISMLTSGVNSINYYSSTCDNFVIKNDVALCRIYRKSSSALNSLSFISAIAARDLEQRTLSSRMMSSRLENNHPTTAYEQQQQQHHHMHHHHLQRLQLQAPPPNTPRVSLSEMPIMASLSAASPSVNSTAQQSTMKTTASLVTHSHAQLVESETQRQQQQLVNGGAAVAARGSYDHRVTVAPSVIECTTTSEEASRQLQIALRTAMAKLDGVPGSSATVNFNDGESIETNGTGIFGRFRSQLVDDTGGGAAACPSRSGMRSPNPEEVAAAGTATTHHERFGHPPNSCSRDISVATPLLRCSSSSDNVVARLSAFTPLKNDGSCCSSPRISIPPLLSHHHVNSSPSTSATTAATTQCIQGAGAASSATALHTINDNSSSSLVSASSNPRFEDEVQTLVNACSIPSMPNTYSLKRSRFTRVQLVGENFPLAKMPSVAQYWRQPSSASDSAAAVAAQLSTFDALSGLAFQYQR